MTLPESGGSVSQLAELGSTEESMAGFDSWTPTTPMGNCAVAIHSG